MLKYESNVLPGKRHPHRSYRREQVRRRVRIKVTVGLRVNDVKQELYKNEVYKISVTNDLGCGRQKGFHESHRGCLDFHPRSALYCM